MLVMILLRRITVEEITISERDLIDFLQMMSGRKIIQTLIFCTSQKEDQNI